MLSINTCACDACSLLKKLFFFIHPLVPACTILRDNIRDDVNLFELEEALQKRRVLQYRTLNGNVDRMVLVDVETNMVVELMNVPPHYLEPSQFKGEIDAPTPEEK